MALNNEDLLVVQQTSSGELKKLTVGDLFNKIPESSAKTLQEVTDAGNTTSKDILIGGNLPGSPNITLNSTKGNATFLGNVGIGTSDPQATLHVAIPNSKETARFERTGQGTRCGIGFVTAGTTSSVNIGSKDGAFTVELADSEKFRVTTGGNVLLGGTLPAAPNITLNKDGLGTFKGGVRVNGGVDATVKCGLTSVYPNTLSLVGTGVSVDGEVNAENTSTQTMFFGQAIGNGKIRVRIGSEDGVNSTTSGLSITTIPTNADAEGRASGVTITPKLTEADLSSLGSEFDFVGCKVQLRLDPDTISYRSAHLYNATDFYGNRDNVRGFSSEISVGTGANRFNFYASGNAKNYFEGRVGIGTDDPQTKLEVDGDVTANNFIGDGSGLINIPGNTLQQVTDAGNATTNGATFLGNVGIGTTNPAYSLDIIGPIRIKNDAQPKLLLNSTEASKLYSMRIGSAGQLYIRDETDSADRITVMTDGNVGIGTTKPLTKLDVAGTARFGVLYAGTAQNTAGETKIALINNDGGGNASLAFNDANQKAQQNGSCARIKASTDSNTGAMVFMVGDNSVSGEANTSSAIMELKTSGIITKVPFITDGQIQSSSDVLIGGTLPSAPNIALRSTGAAHFLGNVGIGTNDPRTLLTIGQVASTSSNSSAYIGFGKRYTTTENNWPFIGHGAAVDGGNYDLGLGARSTSGFIKFYTGNSSAFTEDNVRMVIGNTGNVGIGTTDPKAKLEVQNTNSNLALLSVETGSISTPAHIVLRGTNTNGSASQEVRLSAYHSGGTGKETALNIDVRTNPDPLGSPNTVATFLGSGNVGIGTTNPQATLEVTATDDSGIYSYIGGINNISGDSAVRRIKFFNPAFRAAIQGEQQVSGGFDASDLLLNPSGGNVGIGTTNPIDLLEVTGNSDPQIRVSAESTGASSAGLSIENKGQRNWQIWANRATDALSFGNNSRANTDVVIDSGGNVGIGTDAPQRTLHVLKADNIETARFERTGSGDRCGIGFVTNGTTSTVNIGSKSDAFTVELNNFEKFRVDEDGNVGIGTTNPQYPLQVVGSIRLGVGEGGSSRRKWLFEETDDGSSSKLGIQSFSGSSWNDKLSIVSNGNVGIGTDDPQEILHIKNDSLRLLLDNPGDATVTRANNIRFNYDDGYGGEIVNIRVKDTAATDSYLAFRTGGIASANDKMVIRANGNVGIGTDDPQATLDVSGDVIATTATLGNINTTGNSIIGASQVALIAGGTGRIIFKSKGNNNEYRFFKTDESVYGDLRFTNLTQNRIYQFPNAGGTIALTSDIDNTDYLSLASGEINQNVQSTGETTYNGNLLVTNTIGNSITLRSLINNGNGPSFIIQKSRGTTSPTNVLNNDTLGTFNFSGYYNGWTNTVAYIRAKAIVSGDGITGKMLYRATGIHNFETGNVGIGNDTPLVKLDVPLTARIGTLHVGGTQDGSGATKFSFNVNDGSGNANICFNDAANKAMQNGSCARITSAVDGNTGSIDFNIGNNCVAGTTNSTKTNVLRLETTSITTKAAINSEKDIRVGGTLPAAPNITLSSAGKITALIFDIDALDPLP